MSSGTRMETMLANRVATMMLALVTSPAIHNMMVVTSPIGDHAPPALAARITMLAKMRRSLRSIILRSNAIITIEVVRLSSTADMKKVRMQMIHSRRVFFLVLI